jgi:ribosomal protein S21
MQVTKKPKENVSSLMRRFSQKVRESGILMEAKKSQFRTKPQSRITRRKGALERVSIRKAKMRLRKFGKIK